MRLRPLFSLPRPAVLLRGLTHLTFSLEQSLVPFLTWVTGGQSVLYPKGSAVSACIRLAVCVWGTRRKGEIRFLRRMHTLFTWLERDGLAHMCPVLLTALPHSSFNSSLCSFWNLPLPRCVWSRWRGNSRLLPPIMKAKGPTPVSWIPGGAGTCLDLSSGNTHLLRVIQSVSQASGLPTTESG